MKIISKVQLSRADVVDALKTYMLACGIPATVDAIQQAMGQYMDSDATLEFEATGESLPVHTPEASAPIAAKKPRTPRKRKTSVPKNPDEAAKVLLEAAEEELVKTEGKSASVSDEPESKPMHAPVEPEIVTADDDDAAPFDADTSARPGHKTTPDELEAKVADTKAEPGAKKIPMGALFKKKKL